MCESGARMPALVESCAISTVVCRTIASMRSFTSIACSNLPCPKRPREAPESSRDGPVTGKYGSDFGERGDAVTRLVQMDAARIDQDRQQTCRARTANVYLEDGADVRGLFGAHAEPLERDVKEPRIRLLDAF